MMMPMRISKALAAALLLGCAKQPPTPQVLGPIALVASSAPPVEVAPPSASTVATAPTPLPGPEAPEKRPVDPNLPVGGAGLFLGANDAEIWLLVDGGTVVVDKATRCATESYPSSKVLAPLKETSDLEKATKMLGTPKVLAAVRDLVGLGRRFGRGTAPFSNLETAFSADGRFIFVATHAHLFRSLDGGRSFSLADENPAAQPAVSPDGRHVVYSRCVDTHCTQGREYVSARTDATGRPVVLAQAQAQASFLRMAGDSRALFTRSGADLCLDSHSLDGSSPTTSVCVPLPKEADSLWTTREWQSVSPSGNYGIAKWNERRRLTPTGPVGLTYVVSLVDMKTSRIVKTVLDLEGEVDDAGNMVMRSVSEGGGDHTYLLPMTGPKKLLGNHSLSHWDGKTAALSVWRQGSLGARKCDLLQFVQAP